MLGELRSLVQRGPVSSALLWAAGEILIVVAGVLIACARARKLRSQIDASDNPADLERAAE